MAKHVRLLLELRAAELALIFGRLVDQLVTLEIGVVGVAMAADFAEIWFLACMRASVRACEM